MIEVIISSIYISVFCFCIGAGVHKLLGKKLTLPEANITRLIITGVIALTVAVGWISVFAPIGIVVHIILLLAAVGSAVYSRAEIRAIISRLRSSAGGAIGRGHAAAGYIASALVVLVIAYAASRGSFHTDTGIYHAATIRLYEEYGIIKGIANIQQHYGYNSSYLGFAALFTLSGVLSGALHVTTGFLMGLLALDALYGLRDIRTRTSHYADAARIATLAYIFINYTGTISPATDYGTALMTAYFITEWAAAVDAGATENNKDFLGLLAVYGLFLTTMKLSSALCAIVVILPLVYMIRAREVRKILGFLGGGLLCFAFYPIRNVILSGWLFYPFEAIDLFNVKWKVPMDYSLHDSAQIKVWGRCLYDVTRINDPLSVWLPIWWEAQEHYYQMLIYACILSVAVILLTLILRKKARTPVILMYVMIGANLAVWFFSAPFVRYGLIFLLALPMLGVVGLVDANRHLSPVDRANDAPDSSKPASVIRGLLRYASAALIVMIGLCFCALADHYLMDNLVFIKHEVSSPYYVMQKPFDDAAMGVAYPDERDIAVYYTINDQEINSYYYPPSTCYLHMLERSKPMGDTLKDGFMAR